MEPDFSGPRTPAELGPDVMERVRRIVLKMGELADRVLDRPGREALRSAVDRNISVVERDLQDVVAFPAAVTAELSRIPSAGGVHLAKIPPRIAGAAMVTARSGRGMTAASRRGAYLAKALFECQQDILDDVLDSGTYAFAEARRLYTFTATGLLDPGWDRIDGEARLMALLRPEHAYLAPALSAIESELHRLLEAAPSTDAAFPCLAGAAARLATGQAATVFLRRPTLDLAAARGIGSRLWAPAPGAPWFERLASHATWSVDYTLIDLCFRDEFPSPDALAAHLGVWYDLDVEIAYVDHAAGFEKDLQDGIFNLAWAAIQEGHGSSDLMPAHPVCRADLEGVIVQAARFGRKAIEADRMVSGSDDGFYPFLAAMVPIVLTADGVGNEAWALEAFLRAFDPAAAVPQDVPLAG